ncbi:MAG: ABC transporter permease, partial [Chloroflexota bacterium]|nr:ABC transporter permease [Chloroflexota bacterium]
MTTAASDQLTALREASQTKRRTLWTDAWRRLRRNRAAIAGAAYILLLALIAVFAPMLAPYDPNEFAADAVPNTPPFWMAGHDPRY